MVRALRSSFEHYDAAPRSYNTVPGQFSEWFDGESLANHGMRLSPWEPPRFLWAAIEGVCGLMLTPGIPRINPLIPAFWNWVALRHLPYHDGFLSYFLVRDRNSRFWIYSTSKVQSDSDVKLYDRDVTDSVRVYSDSTLAIALGREDGFAILVGNTGDATVQTPVHIDESEPATTRFKLRTYNSELGNWVDGGIVTPFDLHELVLTIDARGFRLLELSR